MSDSLITHCHVTTSGTCLRGATVRPVSQGHSVNALVGQLTDVFNPLMDTLKPQSNGPLYSNTVICTLAVDGWAVTFGTARRAWAGCGPSQ